MLAALAGMIALAAAPGRVEAPLQAPGPLAPLQGTLLAPAKGPGAPAVLILPGSGPTDRDGDNPLGVKAATYRLLAEGLADRGVTSVRIDKRGLGASKAAVADGNAVTISDYVTDVRAWVGAIRQKTGAPCVWLVGHSEGALVAEAAVDAGVDACGVVLIAGPGWPLGLVLRQQLAANPAAAPLLAPATTAIASLEAGRRVDVADLPGPLKGLFAPQVQGFLIDEMRYDPAVLLARTAKPVLILQGTTDLQVGVAEARRLASAQPRARLVELPGVNHALKAAPIDRAANLATYADPSLPLAPGVVDAIVGLIQARR